jgi:outer membrane protein assembly factor BamB
VLAALLAVGSSLAARSDPPPPELPLLPLETVWTNPLGLAPASAPAFDATQIYLPLESGDLMVLGLFTGELRWQGRLPARAALAAGDGRVVVAGESTLEALSASDGSPQWKVTLDSPPRGTPAVRGGWIFLVLESNELDAYASDTGRRVWRMPLGYPPTTPLLIDGDRLFAGVEGQGVIALDVITGARRWQTPLGGDASALAVLGDRLFAGVKPRFLQALDARSGRERWRWRLGGEVNGLSVDPELVVALSLDQSMRAFKTGNGTQIWREPLNFRPFAGPIRTGSDLVVAGYGPTIRSYGASDGSRRSNYTIPASAGAQGEAGLEALAAAPYIYDPPGFVDDLVVLVTQRGTVLATRRQLTPPITPLTTVPGGPLPLPAAPDPQVPSAPPTPPAPPG